MSDRHSCTLIASGVSYFLEALANLQTLHVLRVVVVGAKGMWIRGPRTCNIQKTCLPPLKTTRLSIFSNAAFQDCVERLPKMFVESFITTGQMFVRTPAAQHDMFQIGLNMSATNRNFPYSLRWHAAYFLIF